MSKKDHRFGFMLEIGSTSNSAEISIPFESQETRFDEREIVEDERFRSSTQRRPSNQVFFLFKSKVMFSNELITCPKKIKDHRAGFVLELGSESNSAQNEINSV